MAYSATVACSRVLFLGMGGSFSAEPLEALLRAGVAICGVLAAVSHSRVPLREPLRSLPVLPARRTIVQIAWDHAIPVFETGDLRAGETLSMVRGLRPDVIAVACFDRIVPREFRELARLAVNIHPSLLPKNRGPAPLFWTFRLGLAVTGVTVHVLEDRADAGPILAQRRVAVPDGIDGALLDQQLAHMGGELLVEVIHGFEQGTLSPRPQDESDATAYPWPSEADWLIPAGWSERRVANFRRGVAHLHS